MCLSSKDRAAYARPYWNAATRHGTLEATTTFHEQHDKRDYRYSYGRCGDEFVRQDGQRGLALGYLTKVRFVRFLSTPLAATLTGVDLARPGQGAERAARVIVVADEFFELLVRYSLSHPFRDGDYAAAAAKYALALQQGPGVGTATLHSNKAAALLALGEHGAALRDATEAVRLDPAYARGHCRKARALLALGRAPEAARCLRDALHFLPGDKKVLALLARAEVHSERGGGGGGKPRPPPPPRGGTAPAAAAAAAAATTAAAAAAAAAALRPNAAAAAAASAARAVRRRARRLRQRPTAAPA